MSFWPKAFWPTQSTDLNPVDFTLWTHVEEKDCKARHSNTDEIKASVNCTWQSTRKGFIKKVY